MTLPKTRGSNALKNVIQFEPAPAPVIDSWRVENPYQEMARYLYAIGLNPFPLPYGKKSGYPWKHLQYTRLHPTHATYGLHNLFEQRCNVAIMAGRTSGNLFFIDCEAPDEFAYQMSMVQSRKIPLWAVSTSRGGHVYLRAQEGEVTSIGTEQLGSYEVRGQGGYVLAPPSVNDQTGVIYDWYSREGDAPPIVSIAQIDWLVDRHGQPVTLSANEHKPKRISQTRNPLTRQTQEYLTSGATLPEGERHNRLRNAACDYNACGFSKADAYTDLEPIARASGLPSAGDPAEISRLIEWAYSAPRTSYRKGAAIPQWQFAEAFADSYVWSGKQSAARKNVFYALIDRARTASNPNGTFRASLRELATVARLSVNTVKGVVEKLKDPVIYGYPLICYAGLDNVSRATLYRFSDHVLKVGRSLVKGLNVAQSASVTADAAHASLSHKNGEKSAKNDTLYLNTTALRYSVSILSLSDVSERGALGHGGVHIYRTLLTFNKPVGTRELANAANVTLNQVRYTIQKLVEAGLAKNVATPNPKTPDAKPHAKYEGYAASTEQLDNVITRPKGKLGKGEARKALFARDRAKRAGELIHEAIAQQTGRIITRAERRHSTNKAMKG